MKTIELVLSSDFEVGSQQAALQATLILYRLRATTKSQVIFNNFNITGHFSRLKQSLVGVRRGGRQDSCVGEENWIFPRYSSIAKFVQG